MAAAFTEILQFNDAAYVSAVKKILEALHPAAWTMCVVAYQNLNPMLQVCMELSREKRGKDVPADLDSFIRMIGLHLEEVSEEIPKRRLGWFFHAALIRRATEFAAQKSEFQSDVAAIWVMLARGSANMSELLPQNALWSDDEKAYFVDIKNQRDGIWYCLNILTPGFLRKNKQLIGFAESQNVFLLPAIS